MKRRQFITRCTSLAAGAAAAAQLRNVAYGQVVDGTRSGSGIVIDPKPLFEISPYLYMQFMEPLGVTDSSVEAAWDYQLDDWRKDFVETTRDLAPGMMRFGGLFSRYYKWREGVGPVENRPWMRNYVWGGKETNRVGTREFVDFCRRVDAEPLYCVNFLGDGRKQYARSREGDRTGDALEAAEWVSYANDPDNRARKQHGSDAPYNIKFWQLGNETSYGGEGFTKDESIAHTTEFVRAMRERDTSIQLIGWGDIGPGGEPWAADLLDRAGGQLDYIAIHMMGQVPTRKDTVLNSFKYQRKPEQAWQELLELSANIERRLVRFEDILADCKAKANLAVTEGHLSLKPHNTNPILTEWLTGVFHARSMNIYQRHGAHVKIATAADFNGTRWTTSALMLAVPGGLSYLLPAGAVMRLFQRHNGNQAVGVKSAPSNLDIAASRTGDRFFLHVANLDYSGSTEVSFAVPGLSLSGGRIFEIAPQDPRQEVSVLNPDAFKPDEHELPPADVFKWRFPARSVSVVEFDSHPV